jgi:hypothetical protein
LEEVELEEAQVVQLVLKDQIQFFQQLHLQVEDLEVVLLVHFLVDQEDQEVLHFLDVLVEQEILPQLVHHKEIMEEMVYVVHHQQQEEVEQVQLDQILQDHYKVEQEEQD